MNERILVPPPGPLAWLYPEFERDSSPDLDGLIEQPPATVTIEDGPRGYALWAWLSQALRRRGVDLVRPSHLPAGSSFEGRMLKQGHSKIEDVTEKGKPRPFPLLPGKDLGERLEQLLDQVALNPARYREAGLSPFFVTERSNGRPADTRLQPSWWGILPGDAWPGKERSLFLDLLRLLHPEKVFLYQAFENYALAGIDCYTESLMGRFNPGRPLFAKKGSRPLVIGVCGTDGSGKSSHVAALKEHLKGLGLKVCVHKIYRHGVFHDTVTDLTRRCEGNRNLHLWRLQRIIKAFDSVKYFYAGLDGDLNSHDVVLFDRYTFTHYAAGVGRYHHDPFARELLSVYPEPDRIYLLDVPTEEALRRIGTRDERTVDENPYMLARYRHALLDLGKRHGFLILDAMKPFEENKRVIVDDVTRLLHGRVP